MEKEKNKILVPVDFTEIADTAIAHAIYLAKHTDSDLYLLHVIQRSMFFVSRKNKYENQLIEAGTMKKLENLASDIEKKHQIATEIIAVQGNIFDTITAVASEIGATFVVMGTRESKGWSILKSNALKVIYHAPLPFMLTQTIKPGQEGYDNIVFPVDYRQESAQKTDWAVYFSKTFGSKINILIPKETDAYLKRKIHTNMYYIKNKFKNNDVEYTINNMDRDNSHLAEETIHFAEEIKANLIMMMVYPSSGVTEFFLTPSQQKLISNPKEIPVFCVNPGTLFLVQNIDKDEIE